MGVVNTTENFANNDVVTSTKMNNIIDGTTFTPDALVSGNTTLELVGGKMRVRAAGITSNELASNAVVSSAITDGSVTTAKLVDSLVTTAKISDSAVTTVKIADANITTAKIVDANITPAKLTGAQTGSAPIYGVRAWVNFDGTTNADKVGTYARTLGSTTATISITSHGLATGQHVFLDFASGTVDGIYEVTVTNANVFTITTAETTAQTGVLSTLKLVTVTASGNISYVGRASASAGRYIVGFSQDMPSANYAFFAAAEDSENATLCDMIVGAPLNGVKTAKSIFITVSNSGNTGFDSPAVTAAFIA